MKNRPLESVKPIVREISKMLNSEDRDLNKVNLLLKQIGVDLNPAEAENKCENSTADKIGIWKKVTKDDSHYYTRDIEQRYQWSLWANVNNIYPKRDKKRILLLGESVARGYLYDPDYSVAMELQGILDMQPETRNTEVIDLARLGLGLDGLLELVRTSNVLEPDVVVIFAGNNWAGVRDLIKVVRSDNNIFELFNKEGQQLLQEMIEQNFEVSLLKLFDNIKEFYLNLNAKVIFVIPEYNLKDWKCDDLEKSFLMLNGKQRMCWNQSKERAIEASFSKDKETWKTEAKIMIELAPYNPFGYELLGELYLENMEWDMARESFEKSRDLVILSGGNPKPRCYSFIRKLILSKAGMYGIEVVDLPNLFKIELKNDIPGKELFLDYCHLTVPGIKFSMRYTVQKIIESLTKKVIPIDSIQSTKIQPSKDANAIAHFVAAAHNVHYGQSHAALLGYHTRKALASSSMMPEMIENYVDFTVRAIPTIFCNSYEKLLTDQYDGGINLLHPPKRKMLDFKFVDILTNELAEIKPDMPNQISELRMKEHGVGSLPIDLLQYFYSKTNYNEFELQHRCHYAKVRNDTSLFKFVNTGSNSKLKFDFTCRISNLYTSDNPIQLFINDIEAPFLKIPSINEWTTASFIIDKSDLVEDVNTITVKWPYQDLKPAGKNKSEAELLDSVYRVYGEIHSFTVQAV